MSGSSGVRFGSGVESVISVMTPFCAGRPTFRSRRPQPVDNFVCRFGPLTRRDDSYYRFPADRPRIPLMHSLKASRA